MRRIPPDSKQKPKRDSSRETGAQNDGFLPFSAASSDAGIFLATSNQALASKEASYNFGDVGQRKTTRSQKMSTELRGLYAPSRLGRLALVRRRLGACQNRRRAGFCGHLQSNLRAFERF